MDYIPSLRTGQNDIKALLNLEQHRKARLKPLISTRGDSDKDLDKFLKGWTQSSFFLDASHYPGDATSKFNNDNSLHSPDNGFEKRREFYQAVKAQNNNIIPVVSWNDSDSQRDIFQFALRLSQDFEIIAIRPQVRIAEISPQISTTRNLLDALADLTKVWLLPDFGYIDAVSQPTVVGKAKKLMSATSSFKFAGMSFLTTSYPDSKPVSGTFVTVSCLDIGTYIQIAQAPEASKINLLYGDYAATNPLSAMEFIPGMPIIPFAAYLTPNEWWQGRLGKTHETAKFVDLAKAIQALPTYHGDNFCWATKEIARIATGTSTTGSNGSWNGIRINQHMCAVLEHMDNGGFSTEPPSDEESEDL